MAGTEGEKAATTQGEIEGELQSPLLCSLSHCSVSFQYYDPGKESSSEEETTRAFNESSTDSQRSHSLTTKEIHNEKVHYKI